VDRHGGHGAERDEMGMMGGCATFGPLLEAYYHRALDPHTAQSVAEHAAGCDACGAALERFAATDRLIASALMPTPGPELRQRLAARIATARTHRSAELRPSAPIKRETVVDDMNGINDANDMDTRPDSRWTGANAQTTPPRRGSQRVRVLLGSAAAVLIVALLAGVLLTRPHGPASGNLASTPSPTHIDSNQTGTATPDHTKYATSDQFSKPAGTCDPARIKANLPAQTLLFDLSMVSPDEGWAVGSILGPSGDPANPLILHYKNCSWTPVAANYPGMTLLSISMDSVTDGWAVGGSSAGQQLALHYTNGTWQKVTLPGENTFAGGNLAAHMRSADEGWIVIRHQKDYQGMLKDGLLHLANGQWSAVTAPFSIVNDILPVAQDEAWMAGYVSDGQQHPVLYHYQAGSWTSVALPSGVAIDRLRMVSPNDIWGSGHISAPTNVDSQQSAAEMRYDGSGWRQVDTSASGQPQFVQAFDRNTSWAFTLNPAMDQNVINAVQYQRNGSWLAVKWPFSDVNMGMVVFGMNSIQRVSADEYWSIGSHGSLGPVLLYFASGAWHAYGE